MMKGSESLQQLGVINDALESTLIGLYPGHEHPLEHVFAVPESHRSEPEPQPELATADSVPSDSVPSLATSQLTGESHVSIAPAPRGIEQHNGQLLRSRLIAAAATLLASLTVFFIRAEFLADPPSPWLLGVVLINTMFCLFGLLQSSSHSLNRLRIIELILFIPIAVQLVVLQSLTMLVAARTGDATSLVWGLHGGQLSFVILSLVYAMFMPNGWRRTLAISGSFCTAPVLATLIVRAVHPESAAILTNVVLLETFLTMLVSLMFAIGGTITMATLRHEAHQARRLGQYQLKKLLDSGGMGRVYLAEHQLLKRPCAIKLIHPGQVNDPLALARFEREVHSTANLSHWHTIEIFDYGHTEDGTFFYVMEYLPGMNLAALVKKFGPMPPERVIHFLRQTCMALQEAHQLGLIHRDLKPANIFAAKRGGQCDVTKLLDFGLVQQCTADAPDQCPIGTFRTSSIAGSPLYMSPEQATAEFIPDPRSDLYSLGAVAYFLLTGHPPFEGKSAVQLILAHARDAVVPPAERGVRCPRDLEQIILRCLAKNPEDRFVSARCLEEALSICVDAGKWTPAAATAWWMKHVPEGNASAS